MGKPTYNHALVDLYIINGWLRVQIKFINSVHTMENYFNDIWGLCVVDYYPYTTLISEYAYQTHSDKYQ